MIGRPLAAVGARRLLHVRQRVGARAVAGTGGAARRPVRPGCRRPAAASPGRAVAASSVRPAWRRPSDRSDHPAVANGCRRRVRTASASCPLRQPARAVQFPARPAVRRTNPRRAHRITCARSEIDFVLEDFDRTRPRPAGRGGRACTWSLTGPHFHKRRHEVFQPRVDDLSAFVRRDARQGDLELGDAVPGRFMDYALLLPAQQRFLEAAGHDQQIGRAVKHGLQRSATRRRSGRFRRSPPDRSTAARAAAANSAI